MSETPVDFGAIADLRDCPPIAAPPLERAILKYEPEDFVVEELPVYEPSGDGEHLFLWIEKRDVTTDTLRGHVGRRLGIAPREIGIAGNKDKRAVTRQFISVPATAAERLHEVDTPAIRVLRHSRHTNKLRAGHLRGNRFRVLLRTDDPPTEVRRLCADSLDQVALSGFANYFGSQRFGGGDTLRLGLELLRGVKTRRSARVGRSLFRLALSAVQSAIFNATLAQRVINQTSHTAIAGDVVCFRTGRTHFVVKDAPSEQARLDAGELVVTGPIPGRRMTCPEGVPAEIERSAMDAMNVTDSDFRRYPKLTSGARRPLVQWPTGLAWDWVPDGLELQFELPAGTYATVLLSTIVAELQSAPSAGSRPC